MKLNLKQISHHSILTHDDGTPVENVASVRIESKCGELTTIQLTMMLGPSDIIEADGDAEMFTVIKGQRYKLVKA